MEAKLLRNDPNIVFAFEIGERSFYQFANLNNIPSVRGLKTAVYFEEMRMKTTLEYLEYHTAANKSIFSKVKIDTIELGKLNEQIKKGLSISLENDFFNTVINALSEIMKLNNQLTERLNIAIEIEIMLKVASILIIDEHEDYLDYDFDYNHKKIDFWKKHGIDFFLRQKPIQELFPVLKDIEVNLEMYMTVVNQMNDLHMANLLQHLHPKEKERLSAKFSSLHQGKPVK